MNIATLNTHGFEAAVAQGLTLVDFWAPWCTYCRRITPAMEALAGELEGKVAVAGVNIDDDPTLAERFQVETIPSLLLLRDGVQVGAALVAPGSKAEIAQWLTDNSAL